MAATALAAAVAVVALAAPLPAQSGSVDGTVELVGDPPSSEPVKVTSDQRYCGDSVAARQVVAKSGGVRNAVVWIEGAGGEPEPRSRTLLNDGCRFVPGVLAAAVGDTLVVENRDSLLHNTNMSQTYTRGELEGESRPLGNFSLPFAGMSVEKPELLEAPGVVDVICDAHGWMEARIRVFDHPHFSVTDGRGRFTIEGVPPGTYTLHVRHPAVGSLERRVTVEPGARTRTDLELGR